MPPKESIEKNGLRISREIQPISKEEQEKNEKDKVLNQRVLDTKKSESNYTEFAKRDTYKKDYAALSEKPEIKTLIAEKETLQKEYEALSNTGGKVEKIGTMLKKVENINDERKKDNTLLANTGIENTLETEKFILQDTLRNLSLQEQSEKDMPK